VYGRKSSVAALTFRLLEAQYYIYTEPDRWSSIQRCYDPMVSHNAVRKATNSRATLFNNASSRPVTAAWQYSRRANRPSSTAVFKAQWFFTVHVSGVTI
jgi:hypothetical protein